MAAKRRRAFGSVKQRGRRWEASYVPSPNAERTRESFPSRPEAEEWLLLQELRLRRGELQARSTVTFGAVLLEWAKERKRKVDAPNTERVRDWAIAKLRPLVGGIAVQDLTLADGERVIQALQAGHLSPKSIRIVLAMAKAALEWARKNKVVTTVEWADLTPPEVPPSEKRSLTREQAIALYREFLAMGAPFGTMLAGGLLTCSRTVSRLGGLRWTDIDWEEGSVLFSQVWLSEPNRLMVTDNSKSTPTRILLDPPFFDVLRTQLTWQKGRAHGMRAPGDAGRWDYDGEPGVSGLVFTNWYGQPMPRETLNRHLGRACRRLGLPEMRTHEACRHTGVSLCVSLGYALEHIAELGGWRDVATLRKTYRHLFMEDVRKVSAGLANLLAGKVG